MRFASWNVRRLNKSPHQRELINFIASNHLSLIGLMETKVKVVNSSVVSKKINKNGNGFSIMNTILMAEFGLVGIQIFGI